MNATEKKVVGVEAGALLDLFPPAEGVISQYAGRIGNGKTAIATYDVLKDLRKGHVVYTNWRINYQGYDERDNLWCLILSLIGFKRRFYYFPKSNLRYIDVDENFIGRFERLTDCKVYLDEGHVAFDSYEMAKMSLQKRKAVLHTRHYDRSIAIISQRFTAIHVSLRANVNIFYKCEKIVHIGPILLFRRTEYQDMVGETVDEEKPMGRHWVWGTKKLLNIYDSKYLRGDMEASQQLHVEGYDLDYKARISRLRQLGRALLARARPKT